MQPKTYIYARVSTGDQTTSNQLETLKGLYPTATVVTETVSGKSKSKPVLENMLAALQPGDKVVAYSLDRLGRSLKDLITTIETVLAAGASLELYRERATYDSAMGKLMIHILGAVAELERELIAERTRTALSARKKAGMKLGRVAQVTDSQIETLLALDGEGASLDAIVAATGLARSTAQRWRTTLREKGRQRLAS